MATPIHYQLAAGRLWPLALATVGLAAAAAVASGLPAVAPRAPARPADSNISQYSQEVPLANPSRGCRWQYSNQANVQIVDCGDETESVRVVFERGHVTEYRVVATQDQTRATPTTMAAPPSSSSSSLSSLDARSRARALPTPNPARPAGSVP